MLLPGAGRTTRPAHWTRSPSKEIGAASVQGRCVEPFADERCGAQDQDAVASPGVGESFDDGTSVLGRHAPLEHKRFMATTGQERGDRFEVGDPAGQDQAVAPLAESGVDIAEDLLITVFVGGERPVCLGDR